MRNRKIRGHKRRQRQIQSWINENKEFRLDILTDYNKDYIDIIIHPWCDISMVNSTYPEPTNKTKADIIDGLIEIYEAWKIQLENLKVPYYLKIWLYNPNFSESQVVCAINEKIDYYENIFFKPDQKKSFDLNNYRKQNKTLASFNWEYGLDEQHLFDNEMGSVDEYCSLRDFQETEKSFSNSLKKAHRTTVLNDTIDGAKEMYSFKRGDVWIGDK